MRPLVLVAEDSLVVRAVLRRQLEAHGYDVCEADDGAAALESCRSRRPQVILLDVEMPRLDGHQVLTQLKSDPALADTPVVFLTGRTRTEDVVEALRHGAHDYLRKPFDHAELIARVSAAARVKALQDELRRRNEELDRLARHDTLTGLHNRRHLEEHLHGMVVGSMRRKQAVGVLLIDVDHFKQINDTYGHSVGDEVLTAVAARLEAGLRADDVAGRWGGEEFLVLLPQTELDGAMAVAERMRASVADDPVAVSDGTSVEVTVSIGCTAAV
ncbi:MAG TPA: diguanylate cyclase, partial [Acidimicrobiales bacterium]|nr:diguanylate cyclase [Acidimicrobiales bacterium]